VCEDISRPLDEQRGAIIEVNASPGLLSHLKPAEGQARPIGTAIVGHLFGQAENGRIPIVGITGSQGTSLTARLVGCLVHLTGKHTGVVSTDGLYLDQRLVTAGNAATWEAGQRLLINRTVQAAVFESNARMILTDGLAYDKCQVGVITDMAGHEALGEFYINDQDGMANVVRTQVDVILPDGVAVLNAAIPAVAELADLCDDEVIFYGVDPALPVIVAHRAAGKRAVILREGKVVLAEGPNETVILSLTALKAGAADQPDSVLAALAATVALGVPADLIGAGLRTFDPLSKKANH
jgi:cyanophycin synthetase